MDKIRKLRSLSERAGTVHEAAAAASKLSALLMKHQLDMRDVDRASLHERYLKEDYFTGYKSMWARSLFAVIARNNFCDMVYAPRTDRVTVVGERDNIDTTYEMFGWLSIELVRLCEKAWQSEGRGTTEMVWKDYDGNIVKTKKVHGKRWKASFMQGATAEVDKILRAQRQQFVNVNNAHALVVDREAELQRMAAEMFGRTRRTRGSATHRGAFASGQKAAGSVNFNKHVSSGTLALKG